MMAEDRTVATGELPLAQPDTIRLALQAIWGRRNDLDAPMHRGSVCSTAAQRRHKARVDALERALEASEAEHGA